MSWNDEPDYTPPTRKGDIFFGLLLMAAPAGILLFLQYF
jgi:hypothetical protein